MKKLYLVGAILGLATASYAQGQDAPNPNQVYIKKITWAGSGCADASSVAKNISADAKAFTLSFNSFVAEVGPYIPKGDAQSKCKIKLDLRFPAGWSYTLFDVDFRGEVALEEGVTATLESKYFFQSTPNNAATFTSSVQGELFEPFTRRDSLQIQEFNWSPCGKSRALNIEADVSVATVDPQASGAFFMDSIDGEFTHRYGIQWTRCY